MSLWWNGDGHTIIIIVDLLEGNFREFTIMLDEDVCARKSIVQTLFFEHEHIGSFSWVIFKNFWTAVICSRVLAVDQIIRPSSDF